MMNVVEQLKAAGFTLDPDYQNAWWNETIGQYMAHVRDGYGVVVFSSRVSFGHLCNGAEYFSAEASAPIVDGDVGAALLALMSEPFLSTTVGVVCGVAV